MSQNEEHNFTWASGPKQLRDVLVFVLLLLPLCPFLLLFPRLCACAAAAWVLLFFTPVPLWWLRRIEARHRLPGDVVRLAVLGGGFAPDGRLSPRTLRRVRHGVELATAKGLELILCGGVSARGRTEAEAMALAAREAGFAGVLHVEGRSLSSVENIIALSLHFGEPGRIAVLTCPQHLLRIRRIAAAIAPGLRPMCYPAERLVVPWGPLGRLALCSECAYECAIHLWLTLRGVLCALGLLVPLFALRRPHLIAGKNHQS